MKETKEIQKTIESISPTERKVLPYIKEDIEGIIEKTKLDRVSVLRALEFLNNKKIISLNIEEEKTIDLDVNGILYKQKGLPERRLLEFVSEKNIVGLEEAKSNAGLSENEFKAALGALKKKALIDLENKKIKITGKKEDISKKTLEEQFIDALPIKLSDLKNEQKYAFENLKNRKKIVLIENKKQIKFSPTELGEEILKHDLKEVDKMIETLTPELIKTGNWKNKRFRRYDITSPVPRIYGGKRHFVNQSIDYGKRIWIEMGFKEMKGNLVQTSFWNFDALFTAQDHPVREIHDTFFLDKKGKLPDKKIVEEIKKAHEKGVGGSKGWRYSWDEEEAKKLCLRTHTTCLSAQTLANLKPEELPAKFFAIGPSFRNETVDWNHGFELLQTEGIVVDENANFKNLLGYLKEFAKKMGFEKVRFRPAYFPYTEPSVEGDVWNEERKEWVELIAAGIFRPEVTEPLLGKPIPVLAWGPGFSRMLMAMFNIKDIRELNKNDIEQLRNIKILKK